MKTYYAANRCNFFEEFIRTVNAIIQVNKDDPDAKGTLLFDFSVLRFTVKDESTYKFHPMFKYQETKLDKSLVYTDEQILNISMSCTRIEDFQAYQLGFPLPVKVEPCFLFSNLAVNASTFSWRGPRIPSVEFVIHDCNSQFYEIQNECQIMFKKILKTLADNYTL